VSGVELGRWTFELHRGRARFCFWRELQSWREKSCFWRRCYVQIARDLEFGARNNFRERRILNLARAPSRFAAISSNRRMGISIDANFADSSHDRLRRLVILGLFL